MLSTDSTDPKPLIAEATGMTSIPCTQPSDEIGTIKWYAHDQLMVSYTPKGKKSTIVNGKSGLSIGDDYSLTLSDLNMNDTGNYTCRLFSINGTSIKNITKELLIQGEFYTLNFYCIWLLVKFFVKIKKKKELKKVNQIN